MDGRDMRVAQEKKYRNFLISKAQKGQKLSIEERQWLLTNPIYNSILDFPYTNMDIIKMEVGTIYKITIKIINCEYENQIIPIVSAPAGKGVITTNFDIYDISRNQNYKNGVKMLGIEFDRTNIMKEFMYKSDLGLMSVYYECEYFDFKQNIYIRKSSLSGDANYAMIREDISENEVMFMCKSPVDNSFSALTFSVAWERINDSQSGGGIVK